MLADVVQDFRTMPGFAADGNVFEIRKGRRRILRCLRHDTVCHTSLRIQPERRRGLETSAQRYQQVIGDIHLGEAALHNAWCRFCRQLDARLIEKLVSLPEVDRPGYGLELAQKIRRQKA